MLCKKHQKIHLGVKNGSAAMDGRGSVVPVALEVIRWPGRGLEVPNTVQRLNSCHPNNRITSFIEVLREI